MALRIRDDLNRDLMLARTPRRIVSLVPSDTDTLFAVGAGERVVGRTRYCVEPAGQIEHIPVCGGTKDIDVDAVLALHPDLVLCNQEENARAPLERLAQRGLAVFVSFPRRMADSVRHVARVVRMLGLANQPQARALVQRGHQVLADAERARGERDPAAAVPVFMPIWADPLMTLSGDTFGSDMLDMAGGRNVFGDRQRLYPLAADLGKAAPYEAGKVAERDTRYPRITMDEVIARAPRAILLPDEPYRFTQADADELARALGAAGQEPAIRFIDGKDVFWYGARGIDSLPRLAGMLAGLAG